MKNKRNKLSDIDILIGILKLLLTAKHKDVFCTSKQNKLKFLIYVYNISEEWIHLELSKFRVKFCPVN